MQQADHPDAASVDNDLPTRNAAPESSADTTPDAAQINQALATLRSQQSMIGGFFGGLISVIIGGVIWAVVTVVTQHQIGWMAVGIGFLVGMAVRKFGRGSSEAFGILGAALALLGCLLGNLLSLGGFIAEKEGAGVLTTELALLVNPAVWGPLFQATFDPTDLLFYGIAIYEGYRFSFRQITRDDLMSVIPAKAEGAADG